MKDMASRLAGKAGTLLASVAIVSLLAGCASQTPPRSMAPKAKPKEYFSEAEYGVKASPRVTSKASNLPRGGGRDQIGKPYQVKGKWYYPKEQPGYSKRGKASWYGDAFHGRLTANGEVYDMTHLSAAHPTMPLPSYARVTNLKNGASIIVRVNDRGPYAHDRVIDLSRRAAEMLDYTHSGIADVKVDYVGRAPLEGRDDEYLLASYSPGNSGPAPSDGLPTGVMIAMAGPTPTAGIGVSAPVQAGAAAVAAAAFPGTLTNRGAPDMAGNGGPFGRVDMAAFPESGPVIVNRPVAQAGSAFQPLSYAPSDAGKAIGALDRMASGIAGQAYVAVGTFPDLAEAKRLEADLAGFGRAEIRTISRDGETWHSLDIHPDGRGTADAILRQAWADGATDAFVVRD